MSRLSPKRTACRQNGPPVAKTDRPDGPSAAEHEPMRRHVKAALVGGLGVAGASTAAAAKVGAAGAVHGLGASLTPPGVLGGLGRRGAAG